MFYILRNRKRHFGNLFVIVFFNIPVRRFFTESYILLYSIAVNIVYL